VRQIDGVHSRVGFGFPRLTARAPTTLMRLSGPGRNYGDAPRAARRPAGKARRLRILSIFDGGATQAAGMPRRPNAAVIAVGTTKCVAGGHRERCTGAGGLSAT
jgi:hypothetical protein